MNEIRTFTNPFSENFLETWQLWKDFKLESFQFAYKGVISEQVAIKHLVDLSAGEEEKAVKIVMQSIRRQWQGFFPLKETTHGTQTKTINISPKQGNGDFKSKVSAAYNSRYGEGGQTDGKSHLKAV